MTHIKPRSMMLALFMGLCCLLAIQPSRAMDYTRFIFGNAKNDQNIDRQDIELLKKIMAEQAAPTPLADANQDGKTDRKL